MVWTPGAGGSQASQDYYNEAVQDYNNNNNNNSGGNNGDNYTGDNILNDIDEAISNNAIQNLIDNKDKYQYLYDPATPNDPRNEYQKMMHALKTGTTYTSPGGIIPSNMMGLPEGINPGQQIGSMSVTGNEQGAAAHKKMFPNPLAKVGAGILDAYQQFSPMAKVMQGIGSAKDKVVEKGKDVVESIQDWALSGPGEASEKEDFDFIAHGDPPFPDIHPMKKGGIVHAADGVFAESETIEMPLTMPEIKQHRKKLEEGFQYDIKVDGDNLSYNFMEELGPSGIAALREREGITAGPDLNYRANGGYMSSFPNQNLNTQSLSASDNIDDRIMKNLEFEKMAPGMMGYNTGGLIEPMAPSFNRGF